MDNRHAQNLLASLCIQRYENRFEESFTQFILGFSGKVTSISTSSSTGFLVAGSLDRYFRLLSSGSPSEGSAGVVGKSYVTSAPTAIIPIEIAGHTLASDEEEKLDEEADQRDDDWGEIQQVSSDEENISQARKKRRKRD